MGIKGYPGVDAQTTDQHQPAHQAQGDPWPWPESDSRLVAQRDAANSASGNQGVDKLPKPAPQFDDEAHRAFMRGLG